MHCTSHSSLYIFLIIIPSPYLFFFFFNDTATTEIYTLSLHDALPIFMLGKTRRTEMRAILDDYVKRISRWCPVEITEIGKHTSELQSHVNLVCRLLLEKKKKKIN